MIGSPPTPYCSAAKSNERSLTSLAKLRLTPPGSRTGAMHPNWLIFAAEIGAAPLPGVTAALTTLPVFGVPVESKALSGVDSLYSIVQMPPGVPVGTLAIGRAGAINAALLAASVLALADGELAKRLDAWRQRQAESVPETPEEV